MRVSLKKFLDLVILAFLNFSKIMIIIDFHFYACSTLRSCSAHAIGRVFNKLQLISFQFITIYIYYWQVTTFCHGPQFKVHTASGWKALKCLYYFFRNCKIVRGLLYYDIYGSLDRVSKYCQIQSIIKTFEEEN
ncbi:Hypothetical_protein [Hexamita inflata]|uniref:Hypothetical_protein n=1 Tax=Hexamita inflata TaxID=28002 RepID=A0ABP1HDM1_9EUKA